MELSQELKQSLESRDLNGIRAALIGYLDLGCESNVILIADEVDKKLSSSGIALFDKDDGRGTTDTAQSAREALRGIKAALRLNFSREKIRKGAELKRQAETSQETVGSTISRNSTITKGRSNAGAFVDGKSSGATSIACKEIGVSRATTHTSTIIASKGKGSYVDGPCVGCKDDQGRTITRGITVNTTTDVNGSTRAATSKSFSSSSDSRSYGTTAKRGQTTDQESATECETFATSTHENSMGKEEVSIPADLKQAVARGETSSVKSILMGFLDVFDKTEPLPVIQIASYCKDALEKKGIQLFAEDDKSIDFSVVPLTAETLRTLKAKMRLNFSLEKMIFAERIFQQELAQKLQKKTVGTTETKPDVEPRQPAVEQKPVVEPRQPAVEQKPVVEPRQPAVEQKPVVEPRQPATSYRPQGDAGSAANRSRPLQDNRIKIEVIYQPGPLEHLFGQVGKFFDCLFNKKGKRIERPYHGRR